MKLSVNNAEIKILSAAAFLFLKDILESVGYWDNMIKHYRIKSTLLFINALYLLGMELISLPANKKTPTKLQESVQRCSI